MTFPAKVYENHEGPALKATKSNADTSEFLMDAVIEACRKAEGCSAVDAAADRQSPSTVSPHQDSSDYPCIDISSWALRFSSPNTSSARPDKMLRSLRTSSFRTSCSTIGYCQQIWIYSSGKVADRSLNNFR